MKAKTKLTKLWSILLALVMVVGMLPTVALAEGSATATADFSANPTAALALLNAAKTADAEDSTWDSTTKTLTLNGVNFETTAAIAVILPDDAKIVLNGDNIITSGEATSDSFGICALGDLTINGDGKLDVTGGTATGNSHGIYATNGLSISGTATVTAKGGAAGYYSYGIGSDTTIDISGGTVYAEGGGTSTSGSFGLCGIVVTISGGADVTAKGGTAANSSSYGLLSAGNVTISGTAKVKATGGTAKDDSCGICANNNVSIEDGIVTATGGTAGSGYDSCGICANNVIIEDGIVSAKGGTATDDSYGIHAGNSIAISGNADVIAISGTANDVCYGIHAKGSIAISGNAKVNATGSKAKDDSYGIYTKGNITITDGTVTANGGTATNDSCGICTKGNITITDGTVTANGGEARDSYGIYASGHDKDNISVKISGTADVTATGGEAGDSYGIYADDDVNIAGGTVNANGGTATNNSFGICTNNGDVNIAGGTVNANGGTATNNSYGIYAHYKVNIAGGTLIAKVTSGNGTANALNKAPKTLPDTYWWRTSNSGAYHKYPASAYIWDAAHTYFEIQKPGYTVTFDANGGSGEMAGADVVSGEYTLPANGFTAPEGKQFKGWSVDGKEKAVGDKIAVAADTTVKAVWENITYTVSFDANDGSGTMANVTGVLGDYTLPKNGFTAPDGKQFKAWSVDGKEKAVGDKITVTADTTVKAVWENIPAAPTEYNILDGANSSWTQDSDGNLSVRGSGAFSEFVGVKVDGKSVDEKYYTVKEGSTIVTLKAGYLNTLTVGSHTLEMIWTDGSASTTFSVNAKSPQTGDNSMMALWIAVLFVSGFGVVATAVYGKKRKSVK